jgi:hypothetical protein
MGNGGWKTADGKWQMGNGGWEMADGKWQSDLLRVMKYLHRSSICVCYPLSFIRCDTLPHILTIPPAVG